MANFFDQFDTAQKEEPSGNFFDQFDQPKAKKKEPAESGGFFDPAAAALKETVTSYIPAAKTFLGIGDQKAATEELLRAREASADAYKQTEFSEIGDAFRQGNISDAVSKIVDKTKEVAGSSLGAMGPAIAAGQAGLMMGGPLAGMAAFGITQFGTYLASNIGRQKEEQQKLGREGEDIARVPAAVAAAGSTLLDVAGGKIFKPIGALMGIEGKATAEKAAMEIVEAATKPGAYRRAVARGAAAGIAFEVPQEVTQQVLERWQAGLPLNPFDDPEAAKEYAEAAGGALLLGSPMGAYSRVKETRAARQSPEGQAILKKATEGTVYDTLSQGPSDIEGFEPEPSGVSAGVVEQPGAEPAATGAGVPLTTGVVSPRPSAPETPEGEGAEPGALAPTEVDKWTARAEAARGAAPAPTAPAPEPIDMGRLDDFRRMYTELRDELLPLLGSGRMDPTKTRQIQTIQKNLREVIDANADLIGDRQLVQQLKNPTFNGEELLAQISAARPSVGGPGPQMNLVPGAQPVNRLVSFAMAATGRDPQAAVEYLEQYRQHQQDRLQSGQLGSDWAIRMAQQYGISRGEAAKNPGAVAEKYLAEVNARIDQAIGDLQQMKPSAGGRKTAKPTAQPDLFSQPEATDEEVDRLMGALEGKPKAAAEEFGAPIPGEKIEEPAAEAAPVPETQKVVEKAPLIDTEHVRGTAEAKTISQFFNTLKPASESPSEVAKHKALRDNAVDALVEYDITKPGEATSPALTLTQELLSTPFGGMDKFRTVMARLDTMSADEQSALFKRAGLPDLTTRRGLEQFYHNLQVELEQMPAPEEGGVKLPTRTMPAAALPQTKAGLPHTEEPFKTQVGTFREFTGEGPKGLPRKSEIAYEERTHAVSDNKIRAALRTLRQKLELRKDLTPGDLAARTYFDNPRRSSVGEVLNALAFDLAMYEIEPRFHGANANFMGEGGVYAERFRDWIEKNLDKKTVELLDELVQEHKQTAKAMEQYDAFVTKWNELKDKQAEERRQAVEKATNTKIPRAPKRKVVYTKVTEAVPETEAGEGEETPELPERYRPRVQGIYEIHPDIRGLLDAGDTNGALQVLSEAKGNPYYAAIAKRLLEAGITAKTEFVDYGSMEPLDLYKEGSTNATMNNYLNSLVTIAKAALPVDAQAEVVAALQTPDRNRIFNAIQRLGSSEFRSSMTRGQFQTIKDAADFAVKNYGWDGKYDPNRDIIVFRRGAGLTNALFLHEALHAATYSLIDRNAELTGVQRQGYDQLAALYKHTQAMLENKTLTPDLAYGMKDLHEFVSEALTNPEFQAMLRGIRYKASPYSLFTWFTNAMRKMLNIGTGPESNVLDEVILSTDAMMAGGISGKAELEVGKPSAGAAPARFPIGRPNTPTAIRNLMTSRSWDEVKSNWPRFYASIKADMRPVALGALTLRQIADLANKRIPQLDNFIGVTERFLARKNEILTESGDISKNWERLQARDPEMSRKLAAVMHRATINEVDPDPSSKLSTIADRQKNPELVNMWKALDPEAKKIYRDVRDFYERRYSEYRTTLNQRLIGMRKFGVSDQTITDIRAEFEKARRKGPYFPLMRHGRFWYQVGTGTGREYYMFESLGQMEAHLDANPRKDELTGYGDQYKQQQDAHTQQSQFLKSAFDAIDNSNMADKQELKDTLYQTWLANQPESSFRNQFVHRQKVAGYSEDALRNFAKSSFHMGYQMSRFENSPELFSQLAAARAQLKGRIDAADPTNKDVMRENNELSDYVKEVESRLDLMLNPVDVGTLPSVLSNIGFIWYLTAPASAMVNVVGGMIIGLPTLVGQQVKLNPNMSYMKATLKSLGEMKTVAAQIMRTGFQLESGARVKDYMLHFPSLTRSNELSDMDKAAYKLFVADGLIDITATYDQSGLAAAPTESYTGTRHRIMQALAGLFHNAERFNREVMAMSAFRTAMEKRKGYADQQKAFDESIAEAKDVTNRSMFDYSSTNKPRYFQHPVARVVLQFKQFPQQMTFFLVNNFRNMIKDAPPEVKREATARFVGTMGMAAIFSGATGLWGFSTVAAIVNAVMNGLDDDRDEPFDFELEFVNWAVETFGKNVGMFLARGAGNAAGVDLASRVKLDDMWFRDGRKNQDEVESLQSFLVDLLGPTVGLGINVAEAMKLWNEGHADRAIEMVSPAFIKQPLVAARYAREGANTLAGDPLMEEFGPFDLLVQSLGLRPAELAERQFYNITKKGQEQAILKERQNLLNLYGITFMSSDFDGNEKALDKIMDFNRKHPSAAIPADSIVRSIANRVKKSAMTDHGLYVDKRMLGLKDESYLD